MSPRRAWSLAVYTLLAALLVYLWVGGGEQGSGDLGSDTRTDGTEPPPPVLETVAKPALPGPGSQAEAAAERPPEKWPYRVYTNTPGARVTLYAETLGKDPAPAPIAKTADGNGFAGFELPELDVPHPLVEAAVEAPGYRPMRRRLENRVVRMTLNRGHAVRGHVFGADGKPLRGAVLRLDGVATRSKADGSFAAYANRAANLRLAAGHRSHLRGHVFVECPSLGVEVKLKRGAEVHGRVTFPDGAPVPGVRVRVYASLCCAVTRANGTYSIRGLVPGRRFRLQVMGRPHWFAAGVRAADLVVHDHVVHFTFRSPSGKTASDIYVTSGYVRENGVDSHAWGWAKNGTFMARTPVDSTVTYAWTAPHIEMGTRELITEHEPRVYYLNETLHPLSGRGRLEVRAPPDRKRWRFRVLMPSGAAMLGFDNLRFEPDDEGRMLLDPLPPGRYQVDLGPQSSWATVVAGETTEVAVEWPR